MLSVIICSVDPMKFSRVTEMYRRLLAEVPFEIVALHDARGLAEAYNRRLSRSRGDLLLFSHDDVAFLSPGFLSRLTGHMAHCDVLGIAGTTRLCDAKWVTSAMPYDYGQVATPAADGQFDVSIWSAAARRIDRMQALDGVFLCAKREVAEAVRFDEAAFTGFHLYDLDFTFRSYLNGYSLSVAADLYPIHESAGPPGGTWEADARKFVEKHAGRLSRPPRRNCRFAHVHVATPEEVVEVMTPPHWEP